MLTIEKRLTRCTTAHGRTPEEFDANFNRAIEELVNQGYEYKVELNMTAGLVAHIFYEVNETERKAETVKDEFELRGEVYLCGQCPYYMPLKDRRSRGTPCMYSEHRVGPTSAACEVFYKRFINGVITPINGEEGIE